MLKINQNGKSPNILAGVDDIIDRYLGVTEIGKTPPHYGHKESCLYLSKHQLPELDMLKLIGEIYEQIVCNRKDKMSKENWRFKLNSKISTKNESLEVGLERAIARIFKASLSEGDYWANQVPTASGLVSHHNDRRRTIDLVHKCREGKYEFIELKVESNTPLYAAIEILLYGILYVFRRKNKDSQVTIDESESTKEQRAQLNAAFIHLKVLAPSEYYKGYDLAWLEGKIEEGLRQIAKIQNLPFRMDFEFQCFPTLTTAELMQGIEDVRIVEELHNRQPFYSRPR